MFFLFNNVNEFGLGTWYTSEDAGSQILMAFSEYINFTKPAKSEFIWMNNARAWVSINVLATKSKVVPNSKSIWENILFEISVQQIKGMLFTW